MPSELLP